LQDAETLDRLIRALVAEAWTLAGGTTPVPIFVKLAPDLSDDALEQALAVCTAAGAEGLIATNTTLARDGIAPADRVRAAEAGGLSGAPLTVRARQVVGFLSARTSLPIIGVGGIMTAADGQAMLDAGASLLQVYTGFVYGGPGFVAELNRLTPHLRAQRAHPDLPGRERIR
jgi:dihydroorotate dehydrogenase